MTTIVCFAPIDAAATVEPEGHLVSGKRAARKLIAQRQHYTNGLTWRIHDGEGWVDSMDGEAWRAINTLPQKLHNSLIIY